MPRRNNVQKPSNKPRLQLALQALKQDAKLSQRRAAAIYKVPQSTLSNRLTRSQPQRDYRPKLTKLLLTEEETVVQHVLDLDARGFPSQLAAVKDMADLLLAEHHQDPVGQNWAANFVKR
jgi:signal transduction histidine kinase